MTTRRGTARRPSVATRPRLTWRAFDNGLNQITGGTLGIFDLSTIGASPDLTALGIFGDYTIRRTRFNLSLVLASVEATITPNYLWYGCSVQGADAVATGGGALPNPLDDAADWYVWGVVPFNDDPTAGSQEHFSVEVDSRAMRRVNENSQRPVLSLFLEAGVDVFAKFAGRMLVSHGRG